MKIDKLLKLAKDNDAQFIDLKLCNLLGSWHHITLPISSLDHKLFKTGVGVDGSSLPGFSSIERGDMILLPDAGTAFIDPFYEQPTLSLICDIMDATDKIQPYSRNPRRVAAAAERYLDKIVKGARAIIGPEFEFYLFDEVNFYQGPQIAFYRVESAEGKREAAEDSENLGYKIPYKKGYHAAPPSMWLRTNVSDRANRRPSCPNRSLMSRVRDCMCISTSPITKVPFSTMLADRIVSRSWGSTISVVCSSMSMRCWLSLTPQRIHSSDWCPVLRRQ
jgi:hypothetical protein